jgi:hypothetical protein
VSPLKRFLLGNLAYGNMYFMPDSDVASSNPNWRLAVAIASAIACISWFIGTIGIFRGGGMIPRACLEGSQNALFAGWIALIGGISLFLVAEIAMMFCAAALNAAVPQNAVLLRIAAGLWLAGLIVNCVADANMASATFQNGMAQGGLDLKQATHVLQAVSNEHWNFYRPSLRVGYAMSLAALIILYTQLRGLAPEWGRLRLPIAFLALAYFSQVVDIPVAMLPSAAKIHYLGLSFAWLLTAPIGAGMLARRIL